MLEYLLRKDDHQLHKYEINTTPEWEMNFYEFDGKRMDKLEYMAQNMIFRNRDDVEIVIKEIVLEKFTN